MLGLVPIQFNKGQYLFNLGYHASFDPIGSATVAPNYVYDQSGFQTGYLAPTNPYLPPAYSMFSTDFGTSRMLRTTNDQDQLLGVSVDVVNKVDNDDEK